MTKDKVSGGSGGGGGTGGGSRAAKKRRRQKVNKNNTSTSSTSINNTTQPPGHPHTNGKSSKPHPNHHADERSKPSPTSSGLHGSNDELRTKRKHAAVDSSHNRITAPAGQPTRDNQYTATACSPARGASSGGAGSSGSGRGQSSLRGGGAETAVPTVIDASAVDHRSRLLLAVDAHEVLADPDVESGLKARQLLQWMVAPLPVEEFYESYW